MKYWIISAATLSDAAILSTTPSEGPEEFMYKKGTPLKDIFPKIEDAKMYFDPNYPDRGKLNDIIKYLGGPLVIKPRIKSLFEAFDIAEEFLQVQLLDHENQVASDDYYIFNCLCAIDFIDMEKSKYRMGALNKSQIKRVKNLVIKEDLEETPNIFRDNNMLSQLFITDKLKQALDESGVQGYKCFEASGWDGLEV